MPSVALTLVEGLAAAALLGGAAYGARAALAARRRPARSREALRGAAKSLRLPVVKPEIFSGWTLEEAYGGEIDEQMVLAGYGFRAPSDGRKATAAGLVLLARLPKAFRNGFTLALKDGRPAPAVGDAALAAALLEDAAAHAAAAEFLRGDDAAWIDHTGAGTVLPDGALDEHAVRDRLERGVRASKALQNAGRRLKLA